MNTTHVANGVLHIVVALLYRAAQWPTLIQLVARHLSSLSRIARNVRSFPDVELKRMIDETKKGKEDDRRDGGSSLFCLIVRKGKKFNQGFRLRRSRKQGEKKEGGPKNNSSSSCASTPRLGRGPRGRAGAIFSSAQPDAQTF